MVGAKNREVDKQGEHRLRLACGPPAVLNETTSELPEDGGFTIISIDALVSQTMSKLRSGALEIRPGQANQLHWVSCIAPGFINNQLAKGSAALVPRATV